MSDPMMVDQARLVAAGWKQTLSGRWWHVDVPSINNRRKMFTTADAIALLEVDPSHSKPEEATA